LTLMFQREVAERLVALPRGPAYGRLSVLVQWLCEARILFDIPPRAFTPPPKVVSSIVRLTPRPMPLMPAGKTALGPTLHSLAERARRRGLVVLFSDLFADPSDVLGGIRHFRHRRHEVIVFHLLDPSEWSFDFKDASTFVDVETGEEVSLEPWQFHTTYRKAVRSWSERYQRECGEQHVDYVRLTTDMPYDVALLRYLEKRRRLF